MEPETSSPVFALYRIARSDGELMISDTQRDAIRMLGELSAGGNGEAREALVSLSRLPGYHILLREMAAAALVIRD
jgi:hypothetical protein